MKKPKFNIGDTVYNKVATRGTYEPSICSKYTSLTINKIEMHENKFKYTCEYDGYIFDEEELMSLKEYKKTL